MIESWQELLNEPIDMSGYNAAVLHYTNLKNKMIDQITTRAKVQMTVDSYNKFADEVETLILQNASTWGEGYQNAQSTLSNIENAVGQIIETQDTSGVYRVIDEIRTQIADKQGKIKDAQAYFKRQLISSKDAIFSELGIDMGFIERMLTTSKTGNASVDDLVNQASSYFIRYLYGKLFDNEQFATNSKFKYVMSMGGYYKELNEYKSLEQILQNLVNVYHAGSVKVDGKDTEMDIIISALDGIESGLTQNTRVSEMLYAFEEPSGTADLINSLLSQINSFGEQVKSRSLGKSTEFEIGNRAELYKSFIAEGGNEYSSLQALHFLARFKNILLSLGPTNVLFSSNGQRQWMADFISEFRRQAYLLAFMRKTNKDKMSQTIGLEQLYTSSKNAIRSRFTS